MEGLRRLLARWKQFQQTITPQRGLSLAWIADTRLSSAIGMNGSFQSHTFTKTIIFLWELTSICEVDGGCFKQFGIKQVFLLIKVQFFVFSNVHTCFVLCYRIAVQFFLYLSILVMSISAMYSVMFNFFVFANFINVIQMLVMCLNLRVYLIVFVFVVEVLFGFLYCIC